VVVLYASMNRFVTSLFYSCIGGVSARNICRSVSTFWCPFVLFSESVLWYFYGVAVPWWSVLFSSSSSDGSSGCDPSDKYWRLPACQGILCSRLLAHILAMSIFLLFLLQLVPRTLLLLRVFVGRLRATEVSSSCLAANKVLSEAPWRWSQHREWD
jgi:hypothetical protein